MDQALDQGARGQKFKLLREIQDLGSPSGRQPVGMRLICGHSFRNNRNHSKESIMHE